MTAQAPTSDQANPNQVELVSADSHVDLGHDAIKKHLASRFHEEYDRALGDHLGQREMHGGRSRANLGEHWFREGHVENILCDAVRLSDRERQWMEVEVEVTP